MRTIVDEFVRNAGSNGTLRILGSAGEQSSVTTWSAVHARAREMASQMASGYGIRPGRRVGVFGDTSQDLVAAVQAVWLAGAAVTVLAPAGLRAVVADARLDLVVTTEPAAVRAIANEVPIVEASTLDSGESRPVRFPDPSDLAVLQYTSGSTRNPRGVPVTHANLAANLTAIRAATNHGASHSGPMLSWLPLYHDMGLIGYLCLSMSCGCSLVLQSPAGFARDPMGWLRAISSYRATSSAAPQFAFSVMRRLLAVPRDLDLSAMRVLISGGEPINAGQMREFAALT